MCGIIGIVGHNHVAAQLYDGLMVLQHRGQDAAGIATADGRKLRVHKGNGLVSEVSHECAMKLLDGHIGIGHCRYPTAGSEGHAEAQPFYVNSPFGIALAHNGNLINTEALQQEVFEQDRRNINTESDSEVMLNVFAHELETQRALNPAAARSTVATNTSWRRSRWPWTCLDSSSCATCARARASWSPPKASCISA